ncbi:MAG TPA: hypothetical protein VGR15_10810 [Bacteroidota bacterium]|jgi:hypothetical protein|nr:hypothetical protein [Bacteroidota bacterium]
MELQQYWQAIQQKICPRCLDGDGEGNCRLPVGEECALKSFLPQMVVTIANVKSTSIESYIAALRRHVCILCDHQQADMACMKRNNLECALDRYYPLVIEIIETVRAEMERAEPTPQA